MKNTYEDIFSTLKFLLWFGKIFSSMTFSIEGCPDNRKAVVKRLDKLARLVYMTISFLFFYISYIEWHRLNLKFSFGDIVGSVVVFTYMFSLPVVIIFGIFRWKKISLILFKIEKLCFLLEHKNINIDYRKIRRRCKLLIFLIMSIFIPNFLPIMVVRPQKIGFLSFYLYSMISEYSIETECVLFIYIVKLMLISFNKYVERRINLGVSNKRLVKEIISTKNNFFSVYGCISGVYGIVIVRIIAAWMSLTIGAYYLSLLDLVTILTQLWDILIWIIVNLSGIGTIIYLFQSSKKEVRLFYLLDTLMLLLLP